MEWVLVAVLLLVVVGALIYLTVGRRRAAANALADARAEAQRWYERLGGQLTNLPGGPSESSVSGYYMNDIPRWLTGEYKTLRVEPVGGE